MDRVFEILIRRIPRLDKITILCRFTTILPDDAIQLEESNEDQSKFGKVLERALTSGPLDSRAFRAGVILNPLRGLTAIENDLSYHDRDVPSPVRPTDKIGKINNVKYFILTTNGVMK